MLINKNIAAEYKVARVVIILGFNRALAAFKQIIIKR